MIFLPTAEAFARTYNSQGYVDPVDAVADYDQYREEFADGEMGSTAISNAMEIPRGRVRSWERGSTPDVVRGIETARENGWLECPVDSEAFVALNQLVAGIYSGGSISTANYSPRFSVDNQLAGDQLRADLEALGAGHTVVETTTGKATAIRPETDVNVLGRVLVAMGAPQGEKAKTVYRLPAYLDSVGKPLRREFVRVYLMNRAVDIADRNLIQITEARPESYLEALAALIHSATEVDTSCGERIVRISDDVVGVLGLDELFEAEAAIEA